MRGTPFFQAIVMIAAFLLVGVPVYQLTRPSTPPPTESASATDTAASSTRAKAALVEVDVVCASAPTDFQIRCLDQTVLAGHAPQAHFSARWVAVVPPEGVDLVVQAHWPAAAGTPPADTAVGANPGAARVTVRLTDGRQVEKSFWAAANGTLTEVFTVPGEAAVAVP